MCRSIFHLLLTPASEVPDFTDPKTLAYIRTWEADYNTLHLIKMIRLRSSLGDIEAKKAEAMEVEDTKMDKTATKA